MRTLRELLREGFEPTPEDVGQILSRAAGLLRYGHEQGAVHGDLSAEALLLERRGGDWAVELAQPGAGTPAGSTAADDVLALGHLLDRLVQDIPQDRLPALFPAALASMTDADPARRPETAQVEQYFSQDYPSGLPADARSAPTAAIPVVPMSSQTGPDDWQPSHHGAAYPDEDLVPFVHEELPEERRGRGAAVLVSLLVLVLGIGGLGFVLWRALGGEEELVASTDTRPTLEDDTAEEGVPDPTTDEVVAATDDPEPASEEVTTQEEASDTQDEAQPTPARPDVPVPTSPVSSAPRETEESVAVDDHTNPDWEGRGWDVQALDAAYCRDGSHFIGLADTQTYRGVICGHASGYSYRGLNKAGNATLHSFAEPRGSGWRAFGEYDVRYEFDEDAFTIYGGDGSVLDEEAVTTWLTPRDTPFRPGDLSISEPITYPDCDGSGVVFMGSWQSVGDVDELVQDALDEHPGSYYIRTDLACDNFNRPSPDLSEKNYIYSVLKPVGYDVDVVCAAIEDAGTYGHWLGEGVDPGIRIDCD